LLINNKIEEMDFSSEIEKYYDNDKYQDVINIYKKNRSEINKDRDLMFYVIDSYLSLKMYSEANSLINEKLPILVSKSRIKELTEDEIEDFDCYLDSKIEILYKTKSYLQLLILMIRYGRWLNDKEYEFEVYNFVKDKILKRLFILLIAVILLVEIGLYFASIGESDPALRSNFRYISTVAAVVYFTILLVVNFFHPVRSNK
jgi:hypothetical protein